MNPVEALRAALNEARYDDADARLRVDAALSEVAAQIAGLLAVSQAAGPPPARPLTGAEER